MQSLFVLRILNWMYLKQDEPSNDLIGSKNHSHMIKDCNDNLSLVLLI